MLNFASDPAPRALDVQVDVQAALLDRRGGEAASRLEVLTTQQKALRINLDAPIYGTFAEIGAGQEVAREFFHAGGASGTIAKSISAYDMVFSDAIYGKAAR